MTRMKKVLVGVSGILFILIFWFFVVDNVDLMSQG